MDIDPLTFEYARMNLEKAGYRDIVLIQGDGGLGHPDLQPYDRIAITAACPDIPPPLLEQLAIGGKLIAPLIEEDGQNLVVFEKCANHLSRQFVCHVLYVNLRGKHGVLADHEP